MLPSADETVGSAPVDPPRAAVSGSRFALGYALPVLVAVVVATSWSNGDGAGMWLFFLGLFAPILPSSLESSRPHRGAVVTIGEVVGHDSRTDGEGTVSHWETVRFRAGVRSIEFKGLCLEELRPLGAPVNVSYRAGEPDHARAVPDDQGKGGLIVLVVILVGFAALAGWSSLLVLGVVGLGYAHFVIADRRRAAVLELSSPVAGLGTEAPKVIG